MSDALLECHAQHRRDLPLRRNVDPYAILVSEVRLEQTQGPPVVADCEGERGGKVRPKVITRMGVEQP